MNSVEFCALDYGFPRGNIGCTAPYTIKVDNEAPLQPLDLAPQGGTDWQARNDFDLRWGLPSQGAGSPIAGYRYRVLDGEGRVVAGPVRRETSQTALPDLSVPRPGAFTVEVMLEDTAGNVGPPARTIVRFDDERPGPAPPVATNEWISRTEIPHLQRITRPGAPLPVSGIEGYAFSVDRQALSRPCADDARCTDAETDLRNGIDDNVFEITDLPEGISYVHTVAVSRSGMSSNATGHAALRVDKTDPTTSLAGAEMGWTNDSVALRATAADPASGMNPASGQPPPFTAIRIDDSPAVTSTGNSVTTALTEEGVHTVAYYARDLAGNVNDGTIVGGIQNNPPETTLVRIDRSEPGVAFLSTQNPDDPELIRAVVVDPLAGPDPSRGSIAVRRVGKDRSFTSLPTEFVDGLLQARWPSDSYPAGEYEFRVTAADRAGNISTTGRRTDGREMVLPNPVKLPTAIRARFRGGSGSAQRAQRMTVPYGQGRTVRGRLTAGLGSPLGGERVQIMELFAEGSKVRRRVTSARTDSRGVFSFRVRPGPSRKIRVGYAGTRTLTRSRSRPLRFTVRTGISLSISPRTAVVGGAPIVFSGRIRKRLARFPEDGKELRLEYRVRGRPWTEFRTLVADARGRVRTRYQFTDSESRGVRFEFRLVATEQSGWPYAPAASAVRIVRGR